MPDRPLADARALVLQPPAAEAPRPRRPPPTPPPDILAQLAAARPAAPAAACRPRPGELADHRRRLEAVMREMLAEPDSGYRPVAVLYQDFLVRCRIQQLGSRLPDLAAFRRLLAVGKAGIPPELAETADWAEALALAAPLPEDQQAVFLLLAQAALAGGALPLRRGDRPGLWHPLGRAGAPGAGVHRGTGGDHLPAGYGGAADRDHRRAGVGNGGGRCRGRLIA